MRNIFPSSILYLLTSSFMHAVTIYTTPSCVYCKKAKEFFAQHNVSYAEKNVAADAEARDEMIRKSGQLGVPVIEIDGAIVIGYDRGRLTELLGIH